MSVTSLEFFLFAAFAVGLCVFLARHHTAKKTLLAVISLGFYASFDLRFVIILAFLACISSAAGSIIFVAGRSERTKRIGTVLAAMVMLLPLSLFKYLPVLAEGGSSEPIGLEGAISDWVLPIGISFYTFQAISYPVDLLRRKIVAPASFLDVLLFVVYFPKLLVGPIATAKDLLPQIQRPFSVADNAAASSALWLITLGLFKKLVLADIIGEEFVDPAFANHDTAGTLFLIIGLYAYSFQIYLDIAGYTDIVRGISRLIGLELPKNFDRPYLAQTVSNFWQRWHISMSSFFREYLYFSIGGSQRGNVFFNLMITFIVIGLWHGAGLTFLVYGLIHGSIVCIERYRRHTLGWRPERPHGLRRWKNIFIVFTFVSAARLLFRAESMDAAYEYVRSLRNIDQAQFAVSYVGVVALIVAIFLHFSPPELKQRLAAHVTARTAAVQGTVSAGVILLTLIFSANTGGFIYAQF